MKNMFKMLGIVAILAMIVLAVGCGPADPDDQVGITVTGIHEDFNNNYAFIYLSDTPTGDPIAKTPVPKKISNRSVTCKMEDDKGAWGKEGAYYVVIGIIETEDTSSDILYTGYTSSKVSVAKGGNTVDAEDFYPAKIVNGKGEEKPTANDYGTYTTKYTNASNAEVTETVVISETSFLISDNTGGRTGTAADHLNFKIENWEKVETANLPTNLPAGYTGGYKFTGRILDQLNYVPSTKTAPEASGFTTSSVAADVKSDGTGTVCWMYIYFKGETGSITFVRSAFSKTGGTENKSLVTGNDNAVRVYTKP